jgi:hypothetical protein
MSKVDGSRGQVNPPFWEVLDLIDGIKATPEQKYFLVRVWRHTNSKLGYAYMKQKNFAAEMGVSIATIERLFKWGNELKVVVKARPRKGRGRKQNNQYWLSIPQLRQLLVTKNQPSPVRGAHQAEQPSPMRGGSRSTPHPCGVTTPHSYEGSVGIDSRDPTGAVSELGCQDTKSVALTEEEEEARKIVAPPAATAPEVEVLPAVKITEAFDAIGLPPFGTKQEQELFRDIIAACHVDTPHSEVLERFMVAMKKHHWPIARKWTELKRAAEKREAGMAQPHETFQERNIRRSHESLGRVFDWAKSELGEQQTPEPSTCERCEPDGWARNSKGQAVRCDHKS